MSPTNFPLHASIPATRQPLPVAVVRSAQRGELSAASRTQPTRRAVLPALARVWNAVSGFGGRSSSATLRAARFANVAGDVALRDKLLAEYGDQFTVPDIVTAKVGERLLTEGLHLLALDQPLALRVLEASANAAWELSGTTFTAPTLERYQQLLSAPEHYADAALSFACGGGVEVADALRVVASSAYEQSGTVYGRAQAKLPTFEAALRQRSELLPFAINSPGTAAGLVLSSELIAERASIDRSATFFEDRLATVRGKRSTVA